MTGAVDAALLEESAEDLYEHAPCGYFTTLSDGRIVKVNRTFLGWTGYARDDLVGRRRVHDLLPPGDRIFYETHYAPLLQMQGSVRELALEVVCADGSRLPVLVNSTVKRDDAGAVLLVRTTVFNAVDRRSYERELVRARREAEARAQAADALEHVADGVLVVDAGARLLLVNAAAEAILGVRGGDVAGARVGEAIPGWDAIATRVPVGAVGRWPTPATLPLARPDGEHWLAVAGVETGDGVVYTIRDTTAQRRLDELRDDLVAIVSHELRTPLAGVYGAAQTLLARADTLDAETHAAMLRLIVEQSERLRRIVDEILLTSRLDAGAVDVELASFDAAALAARVARDVARSLGGEARLEVEAGEPALATGDEAAAEQALAKLVENAFKYSDGGVRVAAESRARTVRIAVADEGPGIPPGERERIFEKFYRLDPDLHGGVGGTGLGLYIARELAARMGGSAGVTAAGGRGATFFLELPRA